MFPNPVVEVPAVKVPVVEVPVLEVPVLEVPVLEVGASVRYVKNDHTKIVHLIRIDISNLSQPPNFTIIFKYGRTIQTTKEAIGTHQYSRSFLDSY